MNFDSNFTGRAVEAWSPDYSPHDLLLVLDLRSREALAEHLREFHGRDDLAELVLRLGTPNELVAYIPVLRANPRLNGRAELAAGVIKEGLRRMEEELAKQGHTIVDVFASADEPALWNGRGFKRLTPVAPLLYRKHVVPTGPRGTASGPVGVPKPRSKKKVKSRRLPAAK